MSDFWKIPLAVGVGAATYVIADAVASRIKQGGEVETEVSASTSGISAKIKCPASNSLDSTPLNALPQGKA